MLAWLGTELKKADTEEYTFFKFDNLYFYILYFNGKPIIYEINGKNVTEEIAGRLRYRIEATREAAAKGDRIFF